MNLHGSTMEYFFQQNPPNKSEIESWLKNHSLFINEEYKHSPDFLKGKKLTLGYHDSGLEQKEWFITDKESTIEFREVNKTQKALIIHKLPLTNCIIESEFVCNDRVLERMKEVLGCTNFSFALRNSEHVSRYIYSGTWFSFQMASGNLREKFCRDMSPDVKALVNKPPTELQKMEVKTKELYPEIMSEYVKFEKQIDVLSDKGGESFNIVLLGITGSGKSSLINHLFNEVVAKSGATPSSVTRNVNFFQGTYVGIKDKTFVELGSDALNPIDMEKPKEDFLLVPKVQETNFDQSSSQIRTIINDIQATAREQEERLAKSQKTNRNHKESFCK